MNFPQATGSSRNLSMTASSIEKPSSVISGRTARPASVIRPSFSSLRQRSLLSSDHLLLLERGTNLCNVTPSTDFVVESIHPKHRASSTASRYIMRPSSGTLPLLSAIQHSRSFEWFSSSHSLKSERTVKCRMLMGSMLTCV